MCMTPSSPLSPPLDPESSNVPRPYKNIPGLQTEQDKTVKETKSPASIIENKRIIGQKEPLILHIPSNINDIPKMCYCVTNTVEPK